MKEIDELTIQKVKKGDNMAFKMLYEHYSPFVWRVILRTSSLTDDEAGEITQLVFIKLIDKIKKFKFKAAFSTWLYRIVYNETINYVKRYKKNNRFDEFNDKTHYNIESGFEDKVNAKRKIEKILSTLTVIERFIVVAKELDDFSFRELSEITKKSEESLRVILHRIKKKVKESHYEI